MPIIFLKMNIFKNILIIFTPFILQTEVPMYTALSLYLGKKQPQKYSPAVNELLDFAKGAS